MDMEHQIDWEKVADNVRRVAEAKATEAKTTYPYLHFDGGAKAGIRRVLGITDRRTFESRWTGAVPYTVSQVVTIAELLGVRAADLLNQDDD